MVAKLDVAVVGRLNAGPLLTALVLPSVNLNTKLTVFPTLFQAATKVPLP